MKYYIIWMHDTTATRDDEPMKVKAKDKRHALKIADNYTSRGRFLVQGVYTLREFRAFSSWWSSLLWGTPAVNEKSP